MNPNNEVNDIYWLQYFNGLIESRKLEIIRQNQKILITTKREKQIVTIILINIQNDQ